MKFHLAHCKCSPLEKSLPTVFSLGIDGYGVKTAVSDTQGGGLVFYISTGGEGIRCLFMPSGAV